MSLVFGIGKLEATALFSENISPGSGILLGQAIWDALQESGETSADQTNEEQSGRIAVAIEPVAASSSSVSSVLSSLVTWASLDSSITGALLPQSWTKSYASIFSPSSALDSSLSSQHTFRIGRTQPTVLSEVVLLAESSPALHLAQKHPEAISHWICESNLILRHGSIVTCDLSVPNGNGAISDDEPIRPYEYRILMTLTVLQGICLPSMTAFIVTGGSIPTDDYENENELDLIDPTPPSHPLWDEESDAEEEGIEIGEDFLANSVPPLSSSSIGHANSLGDTGANIWGVSDSESESESESVGEGLTNGASRGSRKDTNPATLFHPKPLDHRIEAPDAFDKGEDPETIAFLSSRDLGRLGMFSGDWAVLTSTPTASSGSQSRLAKLVARDVLIKSSERQTVVASPLLLHALFPDHFLFSSLSSSPTLTIQPTPFGAHPPSLPHAKSITIARIASPLANNRLYQPLFLRGLKEYLDGKVRLLKVDDLIAVPVRKEEGRVLEAVGSGAGEGNAGKESNGEDGFEETILSQEHVLQSSSPSSIVHFKITNITHDIASSISIEESQASVSDGHYLAATMGELGCWVDSSETKVVQVGVEHARVPDVEGYLGIHQTVPRAFLSSPSTCSASSTPTDKLFDLVNAAFLPNAVQYDLRLSVVLKGARGIGKQTVVRSIAQAIGIHVLEINCFDVIGDTDIKTEATLRARFEQAGECAPCILLLRHIEALAKNTPAVETGKEPPMVSVLQDCLNDARTEWMMSGYPVFTVATTTEPEKVAQGVMACFKHEITFEAPAEAERKDILTNLLANEALAPDVSIKSLATQTAALVAADLVDLVHRARTASIKRTLETSGDSDASAIESGLVLVGMDFESALNEARSSYFESIGAPKIPNVTWDDVGGLAAVKKDILDTIQLPLDHPELFADGMKKRSGILLYGPPGTGKTLLAKAVATSCSLNFFSVKGPELLNMYIGESEANVRRVFQRARDAKPCVIFFDELDSVAPKRGNHGDSGGVMDRIVSQLLAELDGMADGSGGSDVFVIGATNRPDLLDSALLRPGRFDRMLYLGVSDNHAAQLNILRALTRKFRLDPALDLGGIAEQCPFNYTGADFYALCSDAMLKSMARKAQEVDDRIAELNALPPPYSHPHPLTPQYYLAEMATPEEIDVLVSRADFELALRELVPSVSQDEMDHYAEVQKKFAGETINAKKAVEETNGTDIVGNGEPHSGTNASSGDGVVTAPLIARVDKGKGRAVD